MRKLTSREYSEAPRFPKAKSCAVENSAAEGLAFRKRGASEYSLEMQDKFLLRRKRFLRRCFVMSLMAKLILAMTLSWIDENNDKVRRRWIVFAFGRRLDKTHVRKISS